MNDIVAEPSVLDTLANCRSYSTQTIGDSANPLNQPHCLDEDRVLVDMMLFVTVWELSLPLSHCRRAPHLSKARLTHADLKWACGLVLRARSSCHSSRSPRGIPQWLALEAHATTRGEPSCSICRRSWGYISSRRIIGQGKQHILGREAVNRAASNQKQKKRGRRNR